MSGKGKEVSEKQERKGRQEVREGGPLEVRDSERSRGLMGWGVVGVRREIDSSG